MQDFDKKSHILETKSVREIVSDLRKAKGWLQIAALAAFLASAFFVVKYFVGGEMTPQLWTGEQWANAVLGLGITAVITAAQAFLYASGYKGYGALAATVVVVFFGLFSEISQSMEREDATVRTRSESSPVFKAALGQIESTKAVAAAPIASPYAESLAKAETRLAQCRARLANGKEAHCNGDSARVASLKEQSATALAVTSATNTNNLTAAITQAKALEYDEDKHYAMIRLIKAAFGTAGIWASFAFSLIVIGAFEYAFHFVGAYVADHRHALRVLGLDINGDVFAAAGSAQQIDAAPAMQPVNTPAPSSQNDLTRERFFRLIYTEIRAMLINGAMEPTVQETTTAVGDIIAMHTRTLGLQHSITTPEHQRLAEKILERLVSEGVLEHSGNGYALVSRWKPRQNSTATDITYRNELRGGGSTIRNQPLDTPIQPTSSNVTPITRAQSTFGADGNAARKVEHTHPAPAEITVPVQLQAVPAPAVDHGTVNSAELYRRYRSAVLARTLAPTVRPSCNWLKQNGVAGRNQDRETVAAKYIAQLLDDGIIRDAGRKQGDPRGPYELIGN